MTIRLCDNCRKQIKELKESVVLGRGWNTKEFCVNCGKKFLSKLGQKVFIKTE